MKYHPRTPAGRQTMSTQPWGPAGPQNNSHCLCSELNVGFCAAQETMNKITKTSHTMYQGFGQGQFSNFSEGIHVCCKSLNLSSTTALRLRIAKR